MINFLKKIEHLQSNDYYSVPATAKQLSYARQIASSYKKALPKEIEQSRFALSRWINDNKPKPLTGRFANYPSSKQVGFAERIARIKRNVVPHECFKDKVAMSRWIDTNR